MQYEKSLKSFNWNAGILTCIIFYRCTHSLQVLTRCVQGSWWGPAGILAPPATEPQESLFGWLGNMVSYQIPSKPPGSATRFHSISHPACLWVRWWCVALVPLHPPMDQANQAETGNVQITVQYCFPDVFSVGPLALWVQKILTFGTSVHNTINTTGKTVY